MRQRGLQQSDGIRRHAFSVRRLFSFGFGDWLRLILVFHYLFNKTRGCLDAFVPAGYAKKSTPVTLVQVTPWRIVA